MDWTWFYDLPLIYAVMLPFWFLFILVTGRVSYGTPVRAILLFAVVWAFSCSTAVWLIFGLLPGLMH